MIRSSVDLPEPLRPSTPIFAPGRNDSEMSFSTCLSGGWVRESLYIVKMYWLDMARLRLAALLALLVLAGCGDGLQERLDEAERDVRERVAQARADFEERRERFGRRIEEIFDELERAFPRARRRARRCVRAATTSRRRWTPSSPAC